MERKLEVLRNIPIFGGIDDLTLHFLLSRADTVSVGESETFFSEGDIGTAFFVLLEGRVAVLKGARAPLKLSELGEGDCFGEMALLAVAPRSATVRAVTPCVALRLDNRALLELYQRDLEQFTMVQMNLGREVARRLRIANELLFERSRPVIVRSGEERSELDPEAAESTAAIAK